MQTIRNHPQTEKLERDNTRLLQLTRLFYITRQDVSRFFDSWLDRNQAKIVKNKLSNFSQIIWVSVATIRRKESSVISLLNVSWKYKIEFLNLSKIEDTWTLFYVVNFPCLNKILENYEGYVSPQMKTIMDASVSS